MHTEITFRRKSSRFLPLHSSPDHHVHDQQGDKWQGIIQEEQRDGVSLAAAISAPYLVTCFVDVIVVQAQDVRDHNDNAGDPNDECKYKCKDELHLTKQVSATKKKSQNTMQLWRDIL